MRTFWGRFGFGIVAVLWGSALAQADEVRKVQVQKGDTLSGISEREVGRPVYGKRGSLRKVMKLNPKVKNPNYIRVGQWIFVPGAPTAPALAEAAPAPSQPPVPMKESAREDLLAIPLQPPAPAAEVPAPANPAPVEPAKELTVQIQSPSAPAVHVAVPAEAPRRIERVIEQEVVIAPPVAPVSKTPEPKSLTSGESKKTTVTPPPTETVSPATPPVSLEVRPSQLETLRARLWLQARLDQVRRGEVVNRGIASTNVMDFRRFYAEQITGRLTLVTDARRWSVHGTHE